ncbi:MAG: SDR family oxidoreductase [Luteolibacter sp.]
MRIAVTGTTGRVGAALVRHFSTRHEVIPLPRRTCDLADPRSLRTALDQLACDVFVNPAGQTSLEECEDDSTLAMRTNAQAPAEIARWAADRGVPLYHFSTDYVFGGEAEGLRSESETPAPVNTYGRSKLLGEQAVLAHPLNAVVRVSWVFGPDKAAFIDQIFDAALAGKPLAAVADKFSLPVSTGDLAGWMERLIEGKATGVIHACHSGDPITWHDMATAVVEEMAACGRLAGIPPIRKQSLAEMTFFRATRPRFTAMATPRLTALLGHPPRPWREALAEHVRRRDSLL